MSLEAMKSISAAEDRGRMELNEARQRAAKRVAEAEKAGQAAVDAAKRRAREEIAALMRDTEAKAGENAGALDETARADIEEMLARSGAKIPEAAARIVERIVST